MYTIYDAKHLLVKQNSEVDFVVKFYLNYGILFDKKYFFVLFPELANVYKKKVFGVNIAFLLHYIFFHFGSDVFISGLII